MIHHKIFQAKLTDEWEKMPPQNKVKYHSRTEAMRSAYFRSLISDAEETDTTPHVGTKNRSLQQVKAKVNSSTYVPDTAGQKSQSTLAIEKYPIQVKKGPNNENYVKVNEWFHCCKHFREK